ncbi:MAG: M1 family metallopeptidase [Sphingomonadaceae bacterium]|nr:M1 family metallopeptidase [Sphingomonadaceae bacterium]
MRSAALAIMMLAAAPPAKHVPTTIPAKADIGAVPPGRLPDDAHPAAYRIDLTLLPEKARFSGHVEITVDLAAPRPALWINGRDLNVAHVEARTSSGTIVARYEQVDRLGVARLDFARPLPAGHATLVFDYDAPFSSAAAALYHVQVGGAWYAWSQFESIDARAVYPSFDQPGYKTPFTISLTTHAGQSATSNAPETGVVHQGALDKHLFAPTLPLPTYLVEFGVGPFAIATGAVPPTPQRANPLPLRIVATRSNADKLAYALKESPRIVTLLEQYFDRPFPFPKLDQIASPIQEGAMENAGADTYQDNLLLLDDGASTTQRQEFGEVVAHELSHQWFGDLVTPAWWDDIWLNESFANWMGYRIGNAWRPELNIGVGAIDEAFAAMTIDSLVAGRPIHQPITQSGEIDSAFDPVTYGKGGQVVAMIAAYLGDETFRNGVRLHIKRHAYGNATSDDFFAALADAAHDPRIVAAMKSFVDQQGVPVVRVTRAADGGFDVSQKRYALLGSMPAAETWTIPLCMRIGGTRQCDLLDRDHARVGYRGPALGAAPIMPNAGGTGYYRFALDDADWQALIAEGARLGAGEALAASDSLWAGFRAGEIAPARLIEMTRAMAANPDTTAAIDGGQRLGGLRARGLIAAASLPAYRALMAAIYGPRLAALGADLRAQAYAADPPDRQKLRAALIGLVAREAGDRALRARLVAASKAYLGGDAKALDQSILAIALVVYLQDGGVSATEALVAKMAASQDALFRGAAQQALGASDSAVDAQWLLGHFGDGTLRPPEEQNILADMMTEPATRDPAYAYLDANFDRIAKTASIFDFGRLTSMPDRYCSVAKADEIERRFAPRVSQYKRGGLELARTVELVRSCGALARARGAELAAALGNAS